MIVGVPAFWNRSLDPADTVLSLPIARATSKNLNPDVDENSDNKSSSRDDLPVDTVDWIKRTLSSHYQLPMQLAAKTSNFIQRAWGVDENSDGDDSSVDGYVLMVCFCFKFTPSGYIGLQIR